MLCSFYAYIMLLFLYLRFCIESPFLNISQEPKIVDLLEYKFEEEVNGKEYVNIR